MKAFSTLDYTEDKQLGAWQEIMSDVYYSVEVKRTLQHGLRGKIRQYDVGSLSITTFDADEQRVFRTQSRISRDPDDSYVFVTPVRKELYFSQAGRSGFVKPGGYVLVRTSEFYELSCPDGFMNWTVKIPGDEMRRRIPDVDDYCACRFANNLPMAHIARQHIRSVALTFGNVNPPNAASLAGNLVDSISLVVRSETEGHAGDGDSHSQYRIRRRIMDHIRDNIQDPDLTPKLIAEANGISVSYLYKLFQSSETTVGAYILSQRLQAAYERLTTADNAKFTVAEAAYAAGFRNLSHFSRVFREKYHVPPSAIRRQPF
jgi:AraC-like DNA-binding protein